jgi:quinohemoprotein ethanol dehydrogenase
MTLERTRLEDSPVLTDSKKLSLVFVSVMFLVACGSRHKDVDDTTLRAADDDTGNWLMYGKTYDDHRFSPLNQINEQTVSKLGLAWSREMGTTRGLEATPLVKDGVLYTTAAWSVAHAIDAKTGAILWTNDPKVARERAFFYCCDVVNRGVALYRGKVYLGTLDGRLIALDERTGAPLWTVDTTEGGKPYSITSAPRIARGRVIIGNGGSEFGVRGYISAYDAETGKMAWRSYTVPGDPSRGFESKALAAPTCKTGGYQEIKDRRFNNLQMFGPRFIRVVSGQEQERNPGFTEPQSTSQVPRGMLHEHEDTA